MWYRECPSCSRTIEYPSQSNFCRGRRTNAKCAWCAHDGQLLGRVQPEDEKERRAKKLRGKVRSVASRKRYAASKRGNKNPQFGNGRSKSNEHICKIRIGCIKAIEARLNLVGKTISPSFNPVACKIIDEYALKNGYKFQHALNGGEYHIKDLGYWVDGYDAEKNTVVEFYEKEHGRTPRQIKDRRRQKEIIDFLKCSFIIIHENGEIERVSGDFCR
jgi:hypothetical protein